MNFEIVFLTHIAVLRYNYGYADLITHNASAQAQSDGASEYSFVGRPGCTDAPGLWCRQPSNCHNITISMRASASRAGAGLPLSELAMPDLDLIKQEEQVVCDRRGRPVACPWVSACARTMDLCVCKIF